MPQHAFLVLHLIMTCISRLGEIDNLDPVYKKCINVYVGLSNTDEIQKWIYFKLVLGLGFSIKTVSLTSDPCQ